MQVINSRENKQVKLARKLQEKKYRDRTGLFVLEGKRAVGELLDHPELLEMVFIEEGLWDKQHPELQRLQKKAVCLVNPAVMSHISATENPQGIAAIARKPLWPKSILTQLRETAIFLDQIADPGNLGTIIRTTWAFGLGALLLSPRCTDPYSPKVVRSTMGGLLRTPLIMDVDVEDLSRLKEAGYRLYCAHGQGDRVLYDMDLKPSRIVMLFGSEAHGMSGELTALADALVKIPLQDEVDSLNIAVAHGIILSEISRQRLSG